MYDLAIIGSGSAAFATAITASRKGASVIMVERGTVGGTCVNVGCIPSKALLAAAEARHVALDDRFPGIATDAQAVDMAALVAGKNDIVEMLRHEKYEELAGIYGFETTRPLTLTEHVLTRRTTSSRRGRRRGCRPLPGSTPSAISRRLPR